MNTPIPVAILVRVSTLKQETDRQTHELTQLAISRGWEVVETIYEHGTGGTATIRPGLEACVEIARSGRVKKIVVHEVSRVARKNSVAHKFVEDLLEAGVSLYWHAQGVETMLANGKANPAASLLFSILAEQARAERDLLRERIISGLAEAKRKGVVLGRRPGSKNRNSADLLAKYPDVARQLRAGQSIRHAAAITGKSKATVEKIKKLLVRV